MNLTSHIFTVYIFSAAALFFASTNVSGRDSTLSTANLEITTHLGDQQNFVDQDLISFFISLDQDAYLYVFYQNSEGKIYQLIPGAAQTENFFKAGVYIPFPSEDSSFQFYVQEPFGKETIWVYASDQANIKFKNYKSNNTIKQVNSSLNIIENKIVSSSKKLYDRASTIIHTQKQH